MNRFETPAKRFLYLSVTVAVISLVFGNVQAAGKKEAFVKIATGNTGGTYYPVGVGMSQLLSKKNGYIVSSAMSTGGSVDNIGLLRGNEAQVAIMMSTVGNWAYFGESRFKDKQYKDLRVITTLWPNLNHVVVLKDIKDVLSITQSLEKKLVSHIKAEKALLKKEKESV